MAGHTEHGSFEIPFMSGQIDERDHFCRFLAYFHPVQCAVIRFIYNFADTIEAQNVIAHRTGASAFHLVFMPEQSLSCMTTTIVQFTVRQHTQQRRFTSIHIPNNSNPEIGKCVPWKLHGSKKKEFASHLISIKSLWSTRLRIKNCPVIPLSDGRCRSSTQSAFNVVASDWNVAT